MNERNSQVTHRASISRFFITLLLLLLLPGMTTAASKEIRQSLEEQIVDTLIRGEDVKDLFDELQAMPKVQRPEGPRHNDMRSIVAELNRTLAVLEKILPLNGGPATDPERLETARDAVLSAHEEVLQHFVSVEERLREINVSAHITTRLDTAREAYL